MSAWTEETTNKVLQEVARRSATDKEFRKLCLSDPNAAIAAISKTPLPPNFKIRFVENEGVNLTVALPDPLPDGELQDAELELAVGGTATAGPGSTSGSPPFFKTLTPDFLKLTPMPEGDDFLKVHL